MTPCYHNCWKKLFFLHAFYCGVEHTGTLGLIFFNIKFTDKLFLLLLFCVQQATFWLWLGSPIVWIYPSRGLQHWDHWPDVFLSVDEPMLWSTHQFQWVWLKGSCMCKGRFTWKCSGLNRRLHSGPALWQINKATPPWWSWVVSQPVSGNLSSSPRPVSFLKLS